MIDFNFGVSLGPISEVSSEQLFKWRNSKSIYKWCRQFEPLNRWHHDAWLKSLPEREDVRMYAIISKDTLKPVGVCGLTSIDLINRHAEFSLYIGNELQGGGYGKAALKTLVQHGFDALGLNHIFGETFDGNHAAKMFEKVGFKYEGTRRKFYFRDGEYIDAHLYSIIRSDLD